VVVWYLWRFLVPVRSRHLSLRQTFGIVACVATAIAIQINITRGMYWDGTYLQMKSQSLPWAMILANCLCMACVAVSAAAVICDRVGKSIWRLVSHRSESTSAEKGGVDGVRWLIAGAKNREQRMNQEVGNVSRGMIDWLVLLIVGVSIYELDFQNNRSSVLKRLSYAGGKIRYEVAPNGIADFEGGRGDCLLPVSCVLAKWTDISDDDLSGLQTLHEVEVLDLTGTKVTDACLTHVGRLDNLRELRLVRTLVEGNEFRRLAKCEYLRVLEFGNTTLDINHGAIFAALTKMPELRELTIIANDDSLAGIETLTQLTTLRLPHPALTGHTSFPRIARLHSLTVLDLSKSGVSDESIGLLVSLPNLSQLILDHTSISDRGLEKIIGLKSLKELRIQNTKITESGVHEFQRQQPECDVVPYWTTG
jgi:hypothetical protein